METKLNKFKYAKYKFKYLCLKLQNGGYSSDAPQNLAAAAIAVINCSFVNTNQMSVDCNDEIIKSYNKITKSREITKSYDEILKDLLSERDNIINNNTLSMIKKRSELIQIQVKIDEHNNKKKSA